MLEVPGSIPASGEENLLVRSLREIFFQLQDSCLADCKYLLDKTQFCRTDLYVIIVILEIFAGHLSARIKYFVSQNEYLLVLTDKLALFAKTGSEHASLPSCHLQE